MLSTALTGKQGPWQMNCCSLQPWLLELSLHLIDLPITFQLLLQYHPHHYLLTARHFSSSEGPRQTISYTAWYIVQVKNTGSLLCGSLTGVTFPSPSGFKERGNALLSSSTDWAAEGAVGALTDFFPLARCWWGINRAENRNGDFPCKL